MKPVSHLDDYQSAALATANYPGQGTPIGLVYVALKSDGESGEFSEHLGKAICDDNFMVTTDELTPERRTLLKKELGDRLWYIAAGAKELGFSLAEIANTNLEKLADRAARGVIGGSGDNR